MRIRNHLYAGGALLLILSVVACGQGGDGASASYDAAKVPATPASAPIENGAAANLASGKRAQVQPQLASMTVVQRSVIRKAQISVRVDNVEKAEKSVDKLTESLGGYVDSAQSADLASDNPMIDITLRVPVAQFDTALEKFEGLGVRLSKTVSSEDVTGQLVDLDARLKTLEAQEETYRKLLRGVSNLQSVIALQDKLTQVRGDIESMAAQRKTLGSLAALSTVSVHLEQSATAVAPPKDPNWMGQAWGESTTAFGAVGRGIAAIAIWLVVFSPIWAIGLAILWRVVRPRTVRQG